MELYSLLHHKIFLGPNEFGVQVRAIIQNIISVFKTLAKYRTIRSSLWPNVAKSACFLRLADQQERSPSPVKYIREFRKEAIHRIRWTKLAVGLENSAWIQTDDTPRSRSKRR